MLGFSSGREGLRSKSGASPLVYILYAPFTMTKDSSDSSSQLPKMQLSSMKKSSGAAIRSTTKTPTGTVSTKKTTSPASSSTPLTVLFSKHLASFTTTSSKMLASAKKEVVTSQESRTMMEGTTAKAKEAQLKGERVKKELENRKKGVEDTWNMIINDFTVIKDFMTDSHQAVKKKVMKNEMEMREECNRNVARVSELGTSNKKKKSE